MALGLRRREDARVVTDEVLDRVIVERAAPAPRRVDRLAVLAHWSVDERLTRSVVTYLDELVRAGYYVVLVSAAESAKPLSFRHPVAGSVVVLRKPNVGYDFGSWAIGLHWARRWLGAETVLLANDSLVGPFWPLGGILEQVGASSADVVALTDNTQFRKHLQSFFLAFRGGVLGDPPLRDFWTGIEHQADKDRIIHDSELGLSALLSREGYASDVLFPSWKVVVDGLNPTIAGWSALLDQGFPFVKREIVRRPELAPSGDQIGQIVRQRFGVTIEEWL